MAEKKTKIPKTSCQLRGAELTQKSDEALLRPPSLPPAPRPAPHLLNKHGNLLSHSTPQTGPGFTSLYPTLNGLIQNSPVMLCL